MNYVYMQKVPRKVFKVRKWVWGGIASGIVLLIGIAVAVSIIVSNNKASSSSLVSESSSFRDNTAPTNLSNTTIPTLSTTNSSSLAPIAVPLSTFAPSIFNNTDESPSSITGNNTTSTSAPTVIGNDMDVDNASNEKTSVPAPVPIASVTNVPATSSPTYLNEPTTTIFYAHGDIPYEAPQTVILEQQMRSVPLDAEFVIFVGDMRDAGDDKPCVADEYTSVSNLFRLSHAPVFVIQGDNDVSDCPNYEEGKALWMAEFIGFESKYWNHTFDIQRHEGYPDDFSFVHKDTLFIGLDIIGGETRNVTEWETRLSAEATWTTELIRAYQNEYSNATHIGRIVIFGHANPGARHATYFQTISSFIKFELMNSIPILYINGDKHEWMYEPNFYDNNSWLRIGVTGLGAEPLLRITIEADGTYVDPQTAFGTERFL
jgi:hypothetical protein